MQVEGKQLLDVCGYSYIEATTGGRQKSQSTKVINRQIKKHSLMEGVDFCLVKIPDKPYHALYGA